MECTLDLEGDFLSQGTQLLAQLAIELEAEQMVGASRYERSDGRKTYRNGHRDRIWETRVGEIPLRIPKLREGTYFPSLLEPRRRAEKALLSVVQSAYVQGVSTRKVDHLLRAMGLTGIDKSKVSRICKELDELVEGFRSRHLEGSYPYMWLDALYLKVRQDHRIVSRAKVIAIGVRETGERDILGFSLGVSEEYINRPEIALIRIAYLLAFCQFDYGFMTNPALMHVRHQIQAPSERILPDWGILPADFPDES